MPKIRLIQKFGIYGLGNQSFEAGKIHEVDYKTAHYLVHSMKVAVEITPETEKKILEEQKKLPIIPTLTPDKSILKIAVIRLGGIGDTLVIAGFATALKRKYPKCHITYYIRDKEGQELIVGNPYIDRMVMVGDKAWVNIVETQIIPKDYDIVYDSRYMTRIYYKDKKKYQKEQEEADNLIKPYMECFDTFPRANNILFKKFGLNSYDLMFATTDLEGSPDDMYIHLEKKDTDALVLLGDDKYVTVHNGADMARQTKCWDTAYWGEVSLYLKEKGYKIIQLGKTLEEPIKYTIDMRGHSTIKQTAALISKAKFHIDSEGGLVHIARAVGVRSIVLFGPTSMGFFKYDENVNIESPNKCRDCWWTSDMWWRECPKQYPLPVPCMMAIKPDMIIEAIKKIEKMKSFKEKKQEVKYDPSDGNEQFALNLILDEEHYKTEQWQYDRVEAMMTACRGRTVLEVGAGDGYCAMVLAKRGFVVTATEISQIRLDRMKKKGVKAVWADVNKLPFPDNSFDSVICGEVLEHIDSIGKGMIELERVCKPEGKIIISLPTHPEHKRFKLHKWGITHHSILKDKQLNMIVLEFECINR